jgi:hypothetical protein
MQMALWKPFRGKRSDLDSVEKHDGWIYFTTDDASLFFDYVDADGNLQRKQINDALIMRLEALEKLINNSPLADDFDGFGTLDAGTILDDSASNITIIDPGTIIKT